MSLEGDFALALEETVKEARKAGYNPHYFDQMLQEHGGVETARRLIAKSEPQTGLFELYRRRMLDTSMEAVMLQDKFRPLFTHEELAEAHKRLDELDYFK